MEGGYYKEGRKEVKNMGGGKIGLGRAGMREGGYKRGKEKRKVEGGDGYGYIKGGWRVNGGE
jgi:hypothetical protein